MKTHLLPALKLTVLCIIFFVVIYSAIVWGIAQAAAPNRGKGELVMSANTITGFCRIGQTFTADKYFWSRPSAVGYNAAGSAGSNKVPSNPEYLQTVQARIDAFLTHNPGTIKSQIPVELVTASGSGLDPDLSPNAALVQVHRIARVRGIPEHQLIDLINKSAENHFLFGPNIVNVLKLNTALDNVK
jgi:potassium-transporting ATPase KdpC subunit